MNHLIPLLKKCFGCHQASNKLISTPRLSSMDNFRDIAGVTMSYTASRYGVMRTGIFYRSNTVTPSDVDMHTINLLNIRSVFDLHTTKEVTATPDKLPDGASYSHIDIIGNAASGSVINSVHPSSAAEAIAIMKSVYTLFVDDSGIRSQLNRIFNEMASAKEAVLFHCSEGKDRTGWVTAILQSIAGVDKASIMENYLVSNDYTRARTDATLSHMSPALQAIYQPLLTVDASYMEAGLSAICNTYGTMDYYLKEGLELSQEIIDVLRGKMVCYN